MANRFLAAATFAAAMLAAPAAAGTITITSAGLYDYATIKSTGVPVINNPGGVFRLTGTGPTGSVDFDAFCVDLAHTISSGLGHQSAVNLEYEFAEFTADGFGNALSTSQIQQMKGLASLGFSFVGDASKSADIAAIQAAIWQIESPGAVFSSTNAAVNSLIQTYVDLAPTLKGNVRYLAATGPGNVRGQGMFVPGVPEPSSWALLIAGFGFVGFAVRRRPAMRRMTA